MHHPPDDAWKARTGRADQGHDDGETRGYVGRFAPSPTGPLHAGSVATALGSWLDARAHGGRWLVRIEDIDAPREQPGAAGLILETLRRLGLNWDDEPVYQSRRSGLYESAMQVLRDARLAYPCACSRKEIADAQQGEAPIAGRNEERPYPGTCREGLSAGRAARSWRLRVPPGPLAFQDRLHGVQQQDVEREVGDFVLKRADGPWAYQLAVVVDDAAQQVSDVVRGADLLGSTARQIALMKALNLPIPRYLHLPLVLASDGEKLSKQNGATPVDATRPLQVLEQAMRHLQLDCPAPRDVGSVHQWLNQATASWAQRMAVVRAS